MQETIGATGLDRATREKRAVMRASHRGIKEMDLILGGYFTRNGDCLSDRELSAFEAILTRNDQDLYRFITKPDARDMDAYSEDEFALLGRIADEFTGSNSGA